MRIDWSPLAKADRNAIFDYIEEQNLVAAIAVDEQIEIQTDRLLDFPESGRLERRANNANQICLH
ncbi:type II toxin-antitoxin system RelE/ParE family toxin [Hyphococcus sp.]|uniref:type II toxin-antitoxin system RelE/ParE family toxin n=1 Tax=Hyphococcus sp. TaxID=2038636 RepID=UPI0035C70547